MDFFAGQESLTSLEWILRAIIGFFFLLIVAKAMGQRSISQLKLLDFVIALILGNIIAHPLSDEKLGLKGSMLTTTTLALLYILGIWLSQKWPLWQRFLEPIPIILIENGNIRFENVKKARLSVDFLFSELRHQKVTDLQQVAMAVWESGGTISFLLDPRYEPITPTHMKLMTKPFTLTQPVIVQGNINSWYLLEIGKDPVWLEEQIKETGKKINEISFATINTEGKIEIYS